MDLPIAMILPCPACGRLHVDQGEWATRLHTTHLCEHCGLLWKPCLLPTVGVDALCAHTWIVRRCFNPERGVLQARFCSACGDRHPDDPLQAIEEPAAPDKVRVVEYIDEASGELRARVTAPGKPPLIIKPATVDEPSYHPTPGMGLTEAGRRRLREVADAGTQPITDEMMAALAHRVVDDVASPSAPVCFGRGFVHQPQARAENDCASCAHEKLCLAASPRPAGGNPPGNPAENPDASPGTAPAPASGPG